MALALTRREEAKIYRDRLNAERKVEARARQKANGPKIAPHKRQAPALGADADYMAWLHDGLSCIACLRLGKAPRANWIEAAHQKLNVASRGRAKSAGRRGPHRFCLPLCAFHHRLGSPCCDPAQAKFWAILGIPLENVVDLNEALFAAYQQGQPGEPIIRQYARMAA